MPISAPEKDINFILKDETQEKETFKDKLFQWVIQKGRIIIIVTQAIVLIVFLSRFKLDNDYRNLIGRIETNQVVLTNNTELESEYIAVSEKASLVKQAISGQIDWAERLNEFNQNIPQGLSIDSLTYTENNIRFSATASSSQVFQIFIQRLISNQKMSEIILESSRYNRDTQTYLFSLRVTVE